MTSEDYTRPIVVLATDETARNRVAGGLTAALLPVAYAFPANGCALLIVDAPVLSEVVINQALARAKNGGEPKAAPVIFLNDGASAKARESAFLAGAADVLPRSVATELLVARATRLMTMHATRIEALKLSESTLLASPPLQRPSARIFHLCPPGAVPLPSMRAWDQAEFDTPDALLAAAGGKWPDVIALDGADAARLLPGFLSRRGALNTQFVATDAPVDTCAQCLSLGAADAIPAGANDGEVTARISALAVEAQDIDRAHAHLRAGLDMSYSDALTGLRNRRFFDQRFRGLFERARLLDQPLSVLMFDIDGFKQFNDRYGHATGDAILKEFADRLSTNVRAQDLVTRYGGEEFVVATPHAAINVAMGAAERVRAAIAAPGFPVGDGVVATVTVSVGVATISPNDNQAEDLLARADAALFTAKGLGRNRVARAA